MKRETGERILLAADIITLLIVMICILYICKIDTLAATKKTKAEISIEKEIKKYAKKNHKAKGIRILGERQVTNKILKAARKKSKKKAYKKFYKYDIVEKTKVKMIDRYGAYVTCKLGKGGYIDGYDDNWIVGSKVWIYRIWNWKTGKRETWLCMP
ncbi:MAG: hypothetical protein KBT03_12015 [Bacteroidales bacterium]|nr:hypothetical protein [Candidatus Scybalousia scybalohippi]